MAFAITWHSPKKLQEFVRFLNCWTDSIIVVIVALVAYSSYVYLPHYTMSLLAYMNILDSENVLVDYRYTDSRIWIQLWNSKIIWLILWFLLPLIVYYVYYKVLKMDIYIILVDQVFPWYVYNIYFHTSVSIIKVLAFFINIVPQTLFSYTRQTLVTSVSMSLAQSQTNIIFVGILISSNGKMCSILHYFTLGCNLQDPSPNLKWGVAIYSFPLLVTAW